MATPFDSIIIDCPFCVCVCNALLPWMRPDHDFRAISPNKTHPWRVWGWSTVGSILTWHYHILGINLYSSSIKVSCIWQSNKPYRRECCNHKIGRKQVSVEKESIWSGLYICFLLFVVVVAAAFLSFFFFGCYFLFCLALRLDNLGFCVQQAVSCHWDIPPAHSLKIFSISHSQDSLELAG